MENKSKSVVNCGESESNNFAVSLFIAVWETLGKLYHKKQQFALHWIMREEKVLKLFVLNMPEYSSKKCSRSLLFNGYRSCKQSRYSTFPDSVWVIIDDVFANYKPNLYLPKPLKTQMKNLHSNQEELLNLILVREKMNLYSNLFSHNASIVVKLESTVWNDCVGSLLGCWDSVLLSCEKRKKYRFVKIPAQFFFVRKTGNLNYFYDNSGEEPYLVAMVMDQTILNKPALGSIRNLMINLHAAHKGIVRGVGKRSFDSCMTGNGPFHNWRVDNARVSFYAHELKMKKVVEDEDFAKQFDKLLDKYAHGSLAEIILGMYMCWCPELLKSFVRYSSPFFGKDRNLKSSLEEIADLGGPVAYQLFISADYCAEFHRDFDSSDFTLCYASHPDSEISPVEFVLAEYGMRMQIEDGNLFAFRSSVMHGTSYRLPTSNVAYVGALTVNQKLNNLVSKA